jgi:hypothetical protein
MSYQVYPKRKNSFVCWQKRDPGMPLRRTLEEEVESNIRYGDYQAW